MGDDIGSGSVTDCLLRSFSDHNPGPPRQPRMPRIGPCQVLAATLTLSQPGGADYAHPILVSTPSFESHRRACGWSSRINLTPFRIFRGPTLCYNESEWKKIEQVPIPLPKAASSLSDAKKMKKKFLSWWTAEIIQFIRYLIQMDRTKVWFFWGKMLTFYSYPTLL